MTTAAAGALACAGVMAATPASAADKVSVGISGYMVQWVGFTSIEEGGYSEGKKDADGNAVMTQREGAADIRSNSEVHFKGRLEADNGLTFGVRVELEGNNTGVQADGDANGYKSRGGVIDESFAWVSGEFGRLTVGADDSVQSSMHTSVKNAGMDLGEVRMFFPENEAYYTANWQADHKRVIYMTPRMQGFQFGVSYGPGANENYGHQSDGDLADNDGDTWSMAANTSHDFAGGTVQLSVGYINKGSDNDATNFGARVSMSGLTAGLAYLEDNGSDHEMTVAGLMYTDGPLSVSGNFGMNSKAGNDISIGMLSAGYTLAPGVVLKSSLFASESEATQVEKKAATADDPAVMADFEGTGFVMGLAIGF